MTKTSMVPNDLVTSWTAALIEFSSVTSSVTPIDGPLYCLNKSKVSAGGLISAATTFAPSRAKASAYDRPIPWPAPVIKTVRPEKSVIDSTPRLILTPNRHPWPSDSIHGGRYRLI